MELNQFYLKQCRFQNNLIAAFESFLRTEDLADVTLACEGRNLKAHKIILSACSPYFRNIFKENPCKHPVIILKDVQYSELEALLQFIYQGEVLMTTDRLPTFLKIGSLLQINGCTLTPDQLACNNLNCPEHSAEPQNIPNAEETQSDETLFSQPTLYIKPEKEDVCETQNIETQNIETQNTETQNTETQNTENTEIFPVKLTDIKQEVELSETSSVVSSLTDDSDAIFDERNINGTNSVPSDRNILQDIQNDENIIYLKRKQTNRVLEIIPEKFYSNSELNSVQINLNKTLENSNKDNRQYKKRKLTKKNQEENDDKKEEQLKSNYHEDTPLSKLKKNSDQKNSRKRSSSESDEDDKYLKQKKQTLSSSANSLKNYDRKCNTNEVQKDTSPSRKLKTNSSLKKTEKRRKNDNQKSSTVTHRLRKQSRINYSARRKNHSSKRKKRD